jgi:DHA2 family methylenomycin A resistance protein-like MFS transporter
LIGLDRSLSVPTLTAPLISSVPAQRSRTVSPVLNTCRQLGGGLAVAVLGALVAHRETFVQGTQLGLVIAAVLLLATAIASLQLKSTEVKAWARGP